MKVRVVMNLGGDLVREILPEHPDHLFSKEIDLPIPPFPGMALDFDYPILKIHFNYFVFVVSTVTWYEPAAYRRSEIEVEVFLKHIDEHNARAFLSQWDFFRQNGWE